MDADESNQLESAGATVDVLLVGQPLIGPSSTTIEQIVSATDPRCRLTRVTHVEQAAAALQSGTLSPALIVVMQDWPGQISELEIDRLRRAAPLARICALLGSWCEGEVRSGKPWSGTVRCYWHQWPARFHQEITALAAGGNSVWSLPPTASAEERLLAAVPFRPAKQHGLLAIIAADAETAATLADAAQARGYETVALRTPRGARISGAVATLWDTRPEMIAKAELVSEVRSAVNGAPLIALASFPRVADVASATAAGVAAIVSKPFLLTDLFWQVEQRACPGRQMKPD